MLDLLGGEIGELQGRGGEGDKAVRLRGAEFGERLVLDADQLGGGIALGAVPKRVDAEGLDIDAGLVHLRQAIADIRPQEAWRLERVIDHLRRIRNDAMGVHVDGLDPFAADDDLATAMRVRLPAAPRRGAGTGGNLAPDKSDAGRQISADRHFRPLNPMIRRFQPTTARERNPACFRRLSQGYCNSLAALLQ